MTLPSKGGRLIIASDGLWDAMKPKTAAHHIRGMQAGKAAGELVSQINKCVTVSRLHLLGMQAGGQLGSGTHTSCMYLRGVNVHSLL